MSTLYMYMGVIVVKNTCLDERNIEMGLWREVERERGRDRFQSCKF